MTNANKARRTERSAEIQSAETGLCLSEADVQALLRDPSGAPSDEGQRAIAGKVATQYASSAFDPREKLVAEQIFRLLLRDAEVEVRAAIADHIKESVALPRDIVLQMAEDVEAVALPVIRASDVLTEQDLLDMIRKGAQIGSLIAIAERKRVAPPISDALVETGHEDVVLTLVQNPGALLEEPTYARILAIHGGSSQVMAGLAERPQLPLTIAEKLIHAVSDQLADGLKRKYYLGAQSVSLLDKEIDSKTEQARELATLKAMSAQSGRADVERLVNQLYGYTRLSPSILLLALCRGNRLFFELGLAKLSHVPSANARTLIDDKGGLGFQALYAKAGMPERLLPAVRLTINVARENEEMGLAPGTLEYANRMAERLVYFAEDKQLDGLSHILALVRQAV